MSSKLGIQHQVFGYCQICSNDDPRLTFDLFTERSNLVPYAFVGNRYNFFHCHTYLHLSRFFCYILRNYLSYILFWSQLVSVCFTMKLCFSFELHCLQMLLLFQTRDGPIFFIVTFVYTCCAFLAALSRLLKRKFLYITYCISINIYNILYFYKYILC